MHPPWPAAEAGRGQAGGRLFWCEPGTCLQDGKIAYWMYQIYCTTGIQKW
jgi:hypothetical protein